MCFFFDELNCLELFEIWKKNMEFCLMNINMYREIGRDVVML